MTGLPGVCVVGIGLDIVETDRLRRVIEHRAGRFLRRVFCASEQAYCERCRIPWPHYAARFAVKEAVSKAFGTGIGAQIRWTDIEVLKRPESGAPEVRLHGTARALAKRRGVTRVLISLSHGHAYAVGQAVLMGDGPEQKAGSL